MDPLVIVGLILLGGYILSIYLHPYVRCEKCKGLGRHWGSVFTNSLRPCHRCSGTGRKRRLGAVILRRGEIRQSSPRIQPRTRRP